MTSKERVIRTLEFNAPDRIPVDLWISPAARFKYGKKLETFLKNSQTDIRHFDGPCDVSFNKEIYETGEFIDDWECVFTNFQRGLIGEVKKARIQAASDVYSYNSPITIFNEQWEKYSLVLSEKIKLARQEEKFILGGWINAFERMQFLRGTEDLYCDLFLCEKEVYILRDKITEFYLNYLDKWLEMDVDGVVLGDDWGTQISLLISPKLWRKFFKPMYKKFCDKITSKGKYIFFHSDGYILELYDDFIELGVIAINSQLWCMGVEKVAEKYAGKITFWGEISRQDILPTKEPKDIQEAANLMKNQLFINNGGLIGQSEVGEDVKLENIEMLLKAWK